MSFSLKRHSLLYCSILVIFALFFCFSSAGCAYVGLDPTFGTDGLVSTDFKPSADERYALAIDNSGRLVVAGSCLNGKGYDFALARYTESGDLDTTFGTDGVVSTDLGSIYDQVRSLAIDSSGRLVVAGSCLNGKGYDFALVRYTESGDRDTTFGTDGVVSTDLGSGADRGLSLAIDSSGRLVVAGSCRNSSNRYFALVRYTESGDRDTTFGSSGVVSTDFGSGDDEGYSLAIDSSGRLVVAGYCWKGSNSDFALARYTESGDPDTTFGTDGVVSTDFGSGNDEGYSLAIDSSGRLVVAGYCWNGSNKDFALARYTENGSPDTSFGSDGVVSTDFGSGDDEGYSLAIDSSGRLVVAGYCDNGSNRDFALARYTENGSPDTSFGSGGVVSTDFYSGADRGLSLAIDSFGRLVVAGYCWNGMDSYFALARYGKSFTIIPYWSSGGIVTPVSTTVFQGENVDFTISPDISYQIEKVYVDGESIAFEPVNDIYTHTFNNVFADHWLFAVFEPLGDDESTSDDDESTMNTGGGSGCDISMLSCVGLLLAIPLVFLSGKMK